MSATRGFALVTLGDHRLGDAPVDAERRVVEGHPELVVGVVVAVDEVPEQQVGERGEAMGDARRDEQAPLLVAVEVDHHGGISVGEPTRRSASTTRAVPAKHVPVVRLVQVVVEPDEGACDLLGAVALDHLAAPGEPLAPVGLDEAAPVVAEGGGLDELDVGDAGLVEDRRHRLDGIAALPFAGRCESSGAKSSEATAVEEQRRTRARTEIDDPPGDELVVARIDDPLELAVGESQHAIEHRRPRRPARPADASELVGTRLREDPTDRLLPLLEDVHAEGPRLRDPRPARRALRRGEADERRGRATARRRIGR